MSNFDEQTFQPMQRILSSLYSSVGIVYTGLPRKKNAPVCSSRNRLYNVPISIKITDTVLLSLKLLNPKYIYEKSISFKMKEKCVYP